MKKNPDIDTKLEKGLDEALEATFPCSDPVSIDQSGSVSRPGQPSEQTPASVSAADKE